MAADDIISSLDNQASPQFQSLSPLDSTVLHEVRPFVPLDNVVYHKLYLIAPPHDPVFHNFPVVVFLDNPLYHEFQSAADWKTSTLWKRSTGNSIWDRWNEVVEFTANRVF